MSVLLILVISGCKDDFNPTVSEEYVEGMADLDVDISYESMADVVLSSRDASGGDVGTLLDEIKSLVMYVFREDGSLYEKYVIVDPDDPNSHHQDVSAVVVNNKSDNRLEDEKNTPVNGDSSNGRVDYRLRLFSGHYFIYAVANMGTLSDFNISKRDDLKSIRCDWDNENTAANNQMFGVYSVGTPDRAATDDKPVTVSATSKKLHCWMRRLASKVTVAFDGSDLVDGVQVFVTSVTIKDIPKSCALGEENWPGKQSDGTWIAPTKENVENLLYSQGKTITYQELPEAKDMIIPERYLHVCNSKHTHLGRGEETSNTDDVLDTYHANTSEHSLFFYENMQGKGKSKKQSQDGTKIDFPNPVENDTINGWKDNKAFGSYVEVKAYYRSTAFGETMSCGDIVYRFMLGQDVDTNYDARRNSHYKLTLKFKGYGNDADWHIEYPHTIGLNIISPQYISYLYNKQTLINVRITGEIDPAHPYLYAAIIGTDDVPADFPTQGINSQDENNSHKTYWRPGGDGTAQFPAVNIDYQKGSVPNDGPWNSYLSLRKTNLTKIVDPYYHNAPSRVTPDYTTYNRDYWHQKHNGWMEYILDPGTHGDDVDGYYTVRQMSASGEKVVDRLLTIPIFTRAKELITKTAFTGNNPYTAYPRKMRIRFSASLINPATGKAEVKHVYMDVVQVNRIENPKAVWRNKTNNDFHAVLTYRPGEYDGGFEKIISHGKWSAEVYKGDNIVTLSTTTVGSGNSKPQIKQRRIEGADECPIDFTIHFNGSPGFAIVRVRYNDYTCEHDIFVRKSAGDKYDDVDVVGDGKSWSSYNVHHFKGATIAANGTISNEGKTPVLTSSPLEDGSFFRRGSFTAILAENGETAGLKPFEIPGSKTFKAINSAERTIDLSWSNLKASSHNNIWAINGNYRIADIGDFYTLCQPDDDNGLDFPIEKAYGVIYDDGATETQFTEEGATGFKTAEKTPSYGARGVIVYNSTTAKQIFLPIGRTGYGRRKANFSWIKEGDGVLRYATRIAANTAAVRTPLFYDLYKRPGAVYWCREYQTLPTIYVKDQNGNTVYQKDADGNFTLDKNGNKVPVSYSDIRKSSSFDINYYTFGFEGFENNSVNGSNKTDTDACFIRCVK